MKILSIDPGNTESAWMTYDTELRRPISHAKQENHEILSLILDGDADDCVIETVACYGMAVGKEVFETCIWIGRFIQAWPKFDDPHLIYRREVKMHLCNSVKAKDSNIRQVLVDLYGGKVKAIGCKAHPGPLYGISADRWSALAIAVTWADRNSKVLA